MLNRSNTRTTEGLVAVTTTDEANSIKITPIEATDPADTTRKPRI